MTSHDQIEALMNVDPSFNIPERIVPGRTDRAETADHMARYGFAAARARGMTLDLGSGVGYGTAIIAAGRAVKLSVALDISGSALAFGKGAYGEAISFVLGDASALPFSDDSLDSIVCLEAIEHVADAANVLREIARVLRPDGLLIVSTPNKWATSPLSCRPANPYHVREWYPGEFKKLVSTYFEVEEIFGQSWHPVGITWRALRTNARLHLKAILRRLRILRIAQQIHKRAPGSVAEQDSRRSSSLKEVPTREEVVGAEPRSWVSMRKEGVPVTVILIARPLFASNGGGA